MLKCTICQIRGQWSIPSSYPESPSTTSVIRIMSRIIWGSEAMRRPRFDFQVITA